MHKLMHTRAHMHALTFACTNMHANKLMHTLPHVIHVQTYAHTFAPLCMHMHTHTHTHMLVRNTIQHKLTPTPEHL